MLGHFKKLRFAHKYKDLPEEQKEALYLQEIVDEFAFEPEDTARLHQLRTATDARKYEALRALPKFGVATYSSVKETDPELAEKAIRCWAYLFDGPNGQQALCEARKELDGIVEGANLAGNPPSPSTPPKLDRQPGFKGTPPPPAPVPAPALVEETPPPLALPEMTRTYDVPQTTFAFDELAAPSPAEATPDTKPAPEAPPEVQHPTLTVNVEVATNPLGGAGKNLEAALNATDSSGVKRKRKDPPKESVHWFKPPR